MEIGEDRYLLFRIGGGELLATPVRETLAVRQVPAHATCGAPIEGWPEARAVRFADSVLPVLDLSILLGQEAATPIAGHPLLIVGTRLAEVGLVVDEVVCVRCARPQHRPFACTTGTSLLPPLHETIVTRIGDALCTVAVVHVGAVSLVRSPH